MATDNTDRERLARESIKLWPGVAPTTEFWYAIADLILREKAAVQQAQGRRQGRREDED